MPYYDSPTHRPHRRKGRRIRRRRLKRSYRIALFIFILFAVALTASFVLASLFSDRAEDRQQVSGQPEPAAVAESIPVTAVPVPPEPPTYALTRSPATAAIGPEIQSEYAVLVDMDSGEILAEKNSESRINPASMTKILTLLVAAEEITDTEGTFTMTREIADYCFSNECSVVGYEVGEEIPIIELFYGCILCSGADACLALTELACGSHDAFVALMNNKADSLGLSETTHFTNCVGVYHEDHYCTVQDMAKLMKAVMEHGFCREIMSTAVYMSQPTEEHPDGQVLSNWFLRRIEDKKTGGLAVSCGKTGYVPESGNCAVSYGESSSGRNYICVTGKGSSSQQVVTDHACLYQMYCP